jgi:hypothetical protein
MKKLFLSLCIILLAVLPASSVPLPLLLGGGGGLTCAYTPVTTGTQGAAYTGATPSASGGVPTYTFSETGSLPSGLTISSSTGIISGTPTASGSFPTIQVVVASAASNTANCGAAFTLVIAPLLPLDGISTGVKACYSTRQLLTSYGGNAMTVTRSSDSTTQAIGFSSNVLNTTALASFCSGTTCKVTTWNDQCGGGFDQTRVATSAPIIYQSGATTVINGKPAVLFVSATPTYFSSTITPNPVNTLYQNAVIQIASTAFNQAISGPASGAGLEWRFNSSTGTMSLLKATVANIGTSTNAVAASTAAVAESQYNSSTGAFAFWINRASGGTGTQAESLAAGTQNLGAAVAASEFFNGSIGEYISYDLVGGIPSGSQTSIENNQKAYWGTP